MSKEILSIEEVQGKIYLIRGQKVMLDRDLAVLYGVETRTLNQAVTRHKERFPDDFMFKLDNRELYHLKSQSVTSSSAHGGRRKIPRAFTEQGIAMLSSVLRSKQAIAVNIQIIRTFTRMRALIKENEVLRQKLEVMEKRYDEQFKIVFDAIRKLLKEPDESGSDEIGFRV